jgi:hypothetical protein
VPFLHGVRVAVINDGRARSNGIRNIGLKVQLGVGSKRAFNKMGRQAVRLEVAK